MDEIREVALAYYSKATDEEKQKALKYFRSLDFNGDGKVSREEFKLLVKSEYSDDDQLFKALDENGDGSLSLEENKLNFPHFNSESDKNILMDEIREVALAYYSKATDEEKQKALKYFRSLDFNGDGKVSREEFKLLVKSEFSDDDQLFKDLDENGDGSLSLEEVLPLFYMDNVCIRRCDGVCSELLLSSYFTCLICEKDIPDTYNLCCSCYDKRNYQHRHTPENFMDNRSMRLLLLEYMIKTAHIGVPPDSEASEPPQPEQTGEENVEPPVSRLRSVVRNTAMVAHVGVIVATASMSCSIM